VKKKYIYYKKAKGDRVLKFHFKNRKGVEWGILLWNRGGDVLFLKLLSTFPSPNDKNSGTSGLRRDSFTCWIFQEGCIEEEIASMQNLWHFKKGMFVKLFGIKSWDFFGQLTWVTSRKEQEGVGFYHIEIRGAKRNEPQWYRLNQMFSPWLSSVLMKCDIKWKESKMGDKMSVSFF
jgi:hypothetical protein